MELSIESHCDHFTWKIHNFFQLPLVEDYFLDSLVFHFAGDSYCLRLYPNESRESLDTTYAEIYLVRLTSIVPERNVSYKIGHRWRLRERREVESYNCSRAVLEKFGYEIPRYYMEENRDDLVPNGTLTVLCSLRLQESSDSEYPQSDESETSKEEEEQEGVPGHPDIFSPCWRSFTTELSIESPFQYIICKVRDFFQLPSDIGYYLESTEFRFFDDTYLLRLYPNGNVNWNTANIDIQLVRLSSIFPETILSCKLGYTVYWEKGHGVETYYCPDTSKKEAFRFFINRSELEKRRDTFVPDGTLILLCSMRLKDHNVAGSPQSGETETSDAEDKQEGLPSVAKVQSNYMRLLEAA